jgi:hypothetical protein
MTKKELKDIILKTLEKEAGLKALAKAAKTSKNKLKKDLDDMSGVKQHQDGDYISTPIDEIQIGGATSAAKACAKCLKAKKCCGIKGTVSNPETVCIPCDIIPDGSSMMQVGGGKNPQLVNIVKKAMDREGMLKEPMPKQPMRRKPMSRKPMRLREIKEIIKDYISTPINERETAPASMLSSGGSCICQCPAGYGTPTLGNSTFQYGGSGPNQYSASHCEAACNSVPCYELPTDASDGTTLGPGMGKGEGEEFIQGGGYTTTDTSNIFKKPPFDLEKIIDPRKPMRRKPMSKKPAFRRPERSKKPMRLREIKEIIKVMLDEKKKKKKDRCHRKADQVYGTKTSAYKSGAIVKCRKGMIWKKK